MTTTVLANFLPLPETLTKDFWEKKKEPKLKEIRNRSSFFKPRSDIENGYNAVAHSKFFDLKNCKSFYDLNLSYVFFASNMLTFVNDTRDSKKILEGLAKQYIKDHANEHDFVLLWNKFIDDLNNFEKKTAEYYPVFRSQLQAIVAQYSTFREKMLNESLSGIKDFCDTCSAFVKNNSEEGLRHIFAHATTSHHTIKLIFKATAFESKGSGGSGTILKLELQRAFEKLEFEPILRVIDKYKSDKEPAWSDRLVAVQRSHPETTLLTLVGSALQEDMAILKGLLTYERCAMTFLGRLNSLIRSQKHLLGEMRL